VHIHRDAAEAFYVLEGEYILFIERREYPCPAGSFIFIPAGIEHGFRVGGAVSRKLNLYAPAAMVGYFDDLSEAIKGGEVEPDALAEIALKYGMEVRGPVPEGYARVRSHGEAGSSRTGSSRAVSPDHVSDRSRRRLSPALHPGWLRLRDSPDLSLEVEPLKKKPLLLGQLRVPCRIGPRAAEACQPGDLLIDALQFVPESLQLARGDRRRCGRRRLRRCGRAGLCGRPTSGRAGFGGLVLDRLSIGRDALARTAGDNDRAIVNRSVPRSAVVQC
jgi:hypothetical protein